MFSRARASASQMEGDWNPLTSLDQSPPNLHTGLRDGKLLESDVGCWKLCWFIVAQCAWLRETCVAVKRAVLPSGVLCCLLESCVGSWSAVLAAR